MNQDNLHRFSERWKLGQLVRNEGKASLGVTVHQVLQQQQQQQQQREEQECQHQKRKKKEKKKGKKKGKPEGWHSRRHQFPPELGGGRGSQPNPTRTQRNKDHQAKREEKARAAGKPTRSELRGPKRIAYAASCESNAA